MDNYVLLWLGVYFNCYTTKGIGTQFQLELYVYLYIINVAHT